MELLHPKTSFNAGQVTERMRSRYDLKQMQSGLLRCRNWVPTIHGGLAYMTGFEYIRSTRRNKIAKLLPFTYDETQTYTLEFTDGYLRFYDDDGVITETAKNITAVSKANSCQITSNGHGFANGDEVYIEGVAGMTELNKKFFLVANQAANTFTLQDQDGNAINSTAYTTYISGGTVARVYEIVSPYTEARLPYVRIAQESDTVYVCDRYNEPYKLVRTAPTSWTLGTYSRTEDPFTVAISAATKANPCEITTTAAHGYTTGDTIRIRDVAGMTELNTNWYKIVYVNTTKFTLTTVAGAAVDSSGYGAWSSGGKCANTKDQPGAVAFYGGRLVFGGSEYDRDFFWASQLPADDGTTAYDNFTVDTTASSAVILPIGSKSNTVAQVRIFAGTSKFLMVGALGGTGKITGSAGDGSAFANTDIEVKPVDFFGCADIAPAFIGTTIFYVQRGALSLNSFEFDLYSDSYTSIDLNKLSGEITAGGIKEITAQRWRSNTCWCVMNDGRLCGMIYDPTERLAGWFEKVFEGGVCLSASTQIRENGYDLLWVCVERVIDGVTRRYIERLADEDEIPDIMDYYTDSTTKSSDDLAWRTDMYEAQKRIIRMDAALSFDGTQSVALVLSSASAGAAVATTAASFFTASDVGRVIEMNGENGVAEIVGYLNSTSANVNIVQAFLSTGAATANSWSKSTNSVGGFEHLEGETVKVLGDGGTVEDVVVASGVVNTVNQYTYFIAGLGYRGIAKLMPIVNADVAGSTLGRTVTINRIAFSLRNSLGISYGSSLYRLKQKAFTIAGDYTSFPPALVTDVLVVPGFDGYSTDKTFYLYKNDPQPCEVLAVNFFTDISEEA